MCRTSSRLFAYLLLLVLAVQGAVAGDRVPGEQSMQFADTAQAGSDIEKLEPEGLIALMRKARIPGLTKAIIKDGEVMRAEYLGVRDREIDEAYGEETLFEAASLSKPVFATIVLRMCERGEFDLDQPLHELLPYLRLAEDERYRALTARIVLSHRTGLPNWGGEKLELGSYPGIAFGYSGEGFVYLQKVLEKVTGRSLDELARKEIFDPLGLEHSRFSWQEGESLVLARPHDASGSPQDKGNATEANAAASLHTTAIEYARFVTAWMNGELLSESARRQALSPAVGVTSRSTDPEESREVVELIAWGLGWGLQLPATPEEREAVVWHWGDNGDFKAFVAFRPQSRSGIVYFANASHGLAIGEEIVSEVVGDMGPTFRWLGYETHDAKGFVERIAAAEAEAAGRYSEAIEAYRAALAADEEHEGTSQRLEWLSEMVEALEKPVSVEEARLASYAGSYGPRQLSLRDGQLYYQREGRTEYRLLPMSESLFALDGMVGFRLQVEVDSTGSPARLIGQYVGGSRDESPRDAPDQGSTE